MLRSIARKLAIAVGTFGLLWLTLAAQARLSPLVVLHYAADAKAPVGYFFNEDNDIVKDAIAPGASLEFRTSRWRRPDYYLQVSLPLASGDAVELKPPFSRVDIYIGADARMTRTVTDTRFWARFGSA
ncbi:hypothetical protein [Pseudoduganella chitinolytica]|uniref:Uncharacterized protein n=1 Tax=Pseudoduganella chitinolytica TaxID=34070 RepID=A0ABY8BEH4_9BURK|nr:hypothetical protein [Pseudoduganella chitinolytica]WEF34320.1 hypothetical protein PX653_05975 [Pseudoduganella chitinolytica]